MDIWDFHVRFEFRVDFKPLVFWGAYATMNRFTGNELCCEKSWQ